VGSPHACSEVSKAVAKAFKRADKAMHRVAPPKDDSGSTAAILLRCRQHLYLCNVGDSRVILCDEKGCVVAETHDHKPQDRSEQKRITEAGGRITGGRKETKEDKKQNKKEKTKTKEKQDDEARVMGELAMTRAFGDFTLKRAFVDDKGQHFSATKGVVTVVPEILYQKLAKAAGFAVVACDGLWDVMTSEDVGLFIAGQSRLSATEKCAALTKKALALGSADNITIVIIPFD
jgi:serine/threonine protein phosphatase PrpC